MESPSIDTNILQSSSFQRSLYCASVFRQRKMEHKTERSMHISQVHQKIRKQIGTAVMDLTVLPSLLLF